MNLRRFAETPLARKAINTVKDRVAGMRWRIQPRHGRKLEDLAQGEERIAILTSNLELPNPDDSFRSLAEQVLEDVIVGGFGAIEIDANADPSRPLTLWPVDGATIRMRADWDGRPDSPRYVQETGRFGAEGQITLRDDELSYIRLNPRTHTPFGLGRLEVAFETIHNFLSAHRYAARTASNSVVQYALWLQGVGAAQHERLIRWWQDEIEGTGKVPILTADNKPEVLRFGSGTDADLRLQWQEFLIVVIADAFDLPPMLLGLQGGRESVDGEGDERFGVPDRDRADGAAAGGASDARRDRQETRLAGPGIRLRRPGCAGPVRAGADRGNSVAQWRADHRRGAGTARSAAADTAAGATGSTAGGQAGFLPAGFGREARARGARRRGIGRQCG